MVDRCTYENRATYDADVHAASPIVWLAGVFLVYGFLLCAVAHGC